MSEKNVRMKKCCIVLSILGCLTPAYAFPLLENVLTSDTLSEFTVNSISNNHYNAPYSGYKTTEETLIHLDSVTGKYPVADTLLNYIVHYDITKHLFPIKNSKIYPWQYYEYNVPMSPLNMPLVFNAKNAFTIPEDNVLRYPAKKQSTFASLDSMLLVLRSCNHTSQLTQKLLHKLSISRLNEVQYDQMDLPKPEELVFQLDNKKIGAWIKKDVLTLPKPDTHILPKAVFNPWKTIGYTKLQFTQTFVSKNWSKGGESNMAGLTQLYLEADYSESKNFVFENSLDIKIGMNTVSGDTLRSYNISTDQFRAVSKLGLRMYNDWYYTLSSEFNTQLLNNYKTNTYTLKSAFLSPAKLFVGLGVDYKKSNNKKGYNLSVLLTPLTVKMNYLNNIEKFNPKSYGIDPGKHFASELGSKITANLNWKFSEELKLTSKFYYYTDFKYVDTDWENTLDMILNNYFTTTLYIHWKLDDRLKRGPGESLLQTQELISVGMTYRW